MVSKPRMKSKKASEIKCANKHYSKLQKRGKLRKKKKKTSKNQDDHNPETPSNGDQNESIDMSDMVDEKDLNYLKKQGSQYNFLNLRNLDKISKKRKSGEDGEAHYEELPRKKFKENQKHLKPLLPIKGKQGIIQQYMEIEQQDEESSEEQESDLVEASSKDGEEINIRAVSTEELSIKRKKKLAARKEKIACLAMKILENPEENIKCLKELRLMLDEKDRDIAITNRKLVAASLLEIFNDILPSYRIRPFDDKEKQQRMKKETKQLHDYEQALLRHYKAYLQRLEMMIKGLKQKKSGPGHPVFDLAEIGVKCLCELLLRHSTFNFRNNIIALLIPLMAHKTEEISNLVCDTIRKTFKEDKSGDISLEIVRHVSRLLKEKNYLVQPKVLNTFLTLKIHIVSEDTEDDKKKTMTRKEKMMKFSRMERKRRKQMEKLEMELEETHAEESKKHKSKLHSDIISQIFVIYFKILKTMPKSILLPAVLEGLAKFAHLINVDFFHDLITALHHCIASEELTYRENLHCIQTAFTILSGQGDALNIDPQRFYKHLYNTLFALRDGMSSADVPLLLTCFDLAFTKRKKQITAHRVLTFIKRLSILCLQLSLEGIISVLILIKTLMQNHRQTDILLDTDTSQGNGIYLPELEEPEHCNANATCLWELHILLRHQHPEVRHLVQQILTNQPILLTKTPEQTWQSYDFLKSFIDDKPTLPQSSGRKAKSKQILYFSEDLEEKVNQALDSVGDYK